MLYRAPCTLKASLLLLLPTYSFLQLRYLNTSMLLDTFLFIYLDASDLGTLYTKSISAPPASKYFSIVFRLPKEKKAMCHRASNKIPHLLDLCPNTGYIYTCTLSHRHQPICMCIWLKIRKKMTLAKKSAKSIEKFANIIYFLSSAPYPALVWAQIFWTNILAENRLKTNLPKLPHRMLAF